MGTLKPIFPPLLGVTCPKSTAGPGVVLTNSEVLSLELVLLLACSKPELGAELLCTNLVHGKE